MQPAFTPQDRDLYRQRGGEPDELDRQLSILRSPPPPIRLLRACRLGDGIETLEVAAHRKVGDQPPGSSPLPVKFVPASGAATRMFSFLPPQRTSGSLSLDTLRELDAGGDAAAHATLELLQNIDRLAVFPQLEALVRELDGGDWRDLRQRDPGLLLQLLVDRPGLALAERAKGLLPFHRHAGGSRTAFEEHLLEGVGYLTDGVAPARFHFTIAAEHEDAFRALAAKTIPLMASQTGVAVEIEFSLQNPRTDTVAIDSDGRPVRNEDGTLLFRPAGHGSLLDNLARLARDGCGAVFLKNIDNVAPAARHASIARSKRHLAAHLTNLRSRAFELLDELDADEPQSMAAAADFLTREFAYHLPHDFGRIDDSRRLHFLRDRLDRPARVCGVVLNRGEPGGGPFWISREDGSIDGQIVEAAQVDLEDSAQREIWSSSSHFNPVDIVCVLHDRRGEPYDLARFVDPSTSLVAGKMHQGEPIKVLERPGLWNGAMAGWNTVFLEVPEETFTPVKTLLDLLRPAHQP
ncbi:MAG: DUF4301 family protein [Acidobacteriota bacterium]|nr:DUF4301 family protein [Acidobacteriota bacterium]